MTDNRIYWLSTDENGVGAGGYFFRNPLREHIKMLEESTGKKVVAIAYDGSYNIELIVR